MARVSAEVLAVVGFLVTLVTLLKVPPSCGGLRWTWATDGMLTMSLAVTEELEIRLATYVITAVALALLAVWVIPVTYGANVCA